MGSHVLFFTPGAGAALLDTRLGKAAVAICFEADFPELVRRRMREGAEVLINLSNDVWLGAVGQRQHLAMVTLRAVENRTWVIRATTTGISAVIDPFGAVRARTDTFTEAVLDARVVPMRVETIYERYGDVFAFGCVVASLLGILTPFAARERT
jgi:apolipoprotein N-acyltransferase